MDILLSKVTAQAMNYAIRSGITITSGYAIQQATKLLKNVPPDSSRDELFQLQRRLESKIRIIAPAIDMIELIAARGNTSLESAVSLTKDLRREIRALGHRLNEAAIAEEEFLRKEGKRRGSHEVELRVIIKEMKGLLIKIEEAVPMINLAITTSGAKLSTTLPATVSPSRLLQASTFLTSADSMYAVSGGKKTQVGTGFSLSLYMLFQGHASRITGEEDELTALSWKEVIHKARVKLQRVPLEHRPARDESSYGSVDADQPYEGGDNKMRSSFVDEYTYQLTIIEDLNDGRFHTEEDGEDGDRDPRFEDVLKAGIREVVPIHQISKIFYADSGKILNLGGDDGTQTPVLLLKRDTTASPPRMEVSQDSIIVPWDEEAHDDTASRHEAVVGNDPISAHSGSLETTSEVKTGLSINQSKFRFSPSLDPDWLAFEVFEDEEEEEEIDDTTQVSGESLTGQIESQINEIQDTTSKMHLHDSSGKQDMGSSSLRKSHGGPLAIKSSLSLLEMLIRLMALQQFQQRSHLAISDELLNFFLEESSNTGAGPDVDERKRRRSEARRRLGFDPYDESPIHRRKLQEDSALNDDFDDYEEDFDREHRSPSVPENGDLAPRRSLQGMATPESRRARKKNASYPSPGSSPPTMGRSQERRTKGTGWKDRMMKEYPQSPLRSAQAAGYDSGLGTSSPSTPPPS